MEIVEIKNLIKVELISFAKTYLPDIETSVYLNEKVIN